MSVVDPSPWPVLVMQVLICIALVAYLVIDVRCELREMTR